MREDPERRFQFFEPSLAAMPAHERLAPPPAPKPRARGPAGPRSQIARRSVRLAPSRIRRGRVREVERGAWPPRCREENAGRSSAPDTGARSEEHTSELQSRE